MKKKKNNKRTKKWEWKRKNHRQPAVSRRYTKSYNKKLNRSDGGGGGGGGVGSKNTNTVQTQKTLVMTTSMAAAPK